MIIVKKSIDAPPYISSREILQKIIKDIFGTFFVEEDNWIFPPGTKIGRTFFSDRQKRKNAVNHTVTDHVSLLFTIALNGHSAYDPASISRRLAHFYQEVSNQNLDFLIFFGDESEEVLQQKIRFHVNLLWDIVHAFEQSEQVSFNYLTHVIDSRYRKMVSWLLARCQGTYTETVIREISENQA